MLLMLDQNRIRLEYTQQELIEMGLSVAAGQWNIEKVIAWIRQHRSS